MNIQRIRKNWKLVVGVVAALLVLAALGVGGVVRAQSTASEAPVVIRLQVDYDVNGVPSVMGLSANHLAAFGISAPVAIAPGQLQVIHDNKIEKVVLQTRPDGLYISVNDEALPHLAWDGKSLQTLVKYLPVAGIYIDQQYANLIDIASQVPTKLDVQLTMTFAPSGG